MILTSNSPIDWCFFQPSSVPNAARMEPGDLVLVHGLTSEAASDGKSGEWFLGINGFKMGQTWNTIRCIPNNMIWYDMIWQICPEVRDGSPKIPLKSWFPSLLHGICSKYSLGILWLPRTIQKRQGLNCTATGKTTYLGRGCLGNQLLYPWFLLSRCPAGGPITQWSVGQSHPACQRIRTFGGPCVLLCGSHPHATDNYQLGMIFSHPPIDDNI